MIILTTTVKPITVAVLMMRNGQCKKYVWLKHEYFVIIIWFKLLPKEAIVDSDREARKLYEKKLNFSVIQYTYLMFLFLHGLI